MPRLLFSLRGVPDDEADEIRQLLTQHNIDYYETSAGNWGISMPAFWIRDEEVFNHARLLLNEYHRQRACHQQAIYQTLKRQNKHKRFINSVIKHPIRLIVYVTFILFIIYLQFKMIVELAGLDA